MKEGSGERSFEVTEAGKYAFVWLLNPRRSYIPALGTWSWTFFAD